MKKNIWPNFITDISKIKKLSKKERERLRKVTKKYEFKANEYYLSLINWKDPSDPIKRIIIPSVEELNKWGILDPSNEKNYTVLPGMQHKYSSTTLLLVSETCGGICRYCFRKRIFIKKGEEVLKNFNKVFDYLKKHKEVNNVLLTGGDSLMLPTKKLERIIRRLREIKHIKIIRLGTKMPAYYPFRIINDKELIKVIKRYNEKERRIYIITHFNHPREITKEAINAIDKLLKTGAILANQTPILRGINDKTEILAELFNKLSFIGVPPYYVFQNRPTVANKSFAVPIEEGYDIFEKARTLTSGLGKRARFVMSTVYGKIQIIGKTDTDIIMKYFRTPDRENSGKIIIFERNPDAYWIDDYKEVKKDYKLAFA